MRTARWLGVLSLAVLAGCQEKAPVAVVVPAPVAKAAPASAPAAKAPAAPAGAPVALGAKLAGLPVVTVAQLVKDPAAYAGKRVRIEGTIASYCFHKRDWYAVRDGAEPGPSVRILTGEGFLVPENVQGKRARTEGVVEVMDVPAERARHYAGEHGLGDLRQVQGSQPFKQVTIRALGAEFT